MAVMWIKSAWNVVTPLTVKHCFKKTGFPKERSDYSGIERLMDEEMANLSELVLLSNMSMDTREFFQNDANVIMENNSLDVKDILELVQESYEIKYKIQNKVNASRKSMLIYTLCT